MKIICVDDEQPALKNFSLTVRDFPDIEDVRLFSDASAALEWVRGEHVDAAFLDMEMPEMHGLELARQMSAADPDIRIVFVTAYDRYALEAFGVNAVGYVLKPYSAADIRNELDKAARIMPAAKKLVQIDTIPDFVVRIDGRIVSFSRPKVEELFALLVDRADSGLTAGEAIADLWPERPSDDNTRALYRNTFKRLLDMLKELGIDSIICSDGRKRYIDQEMVSCDLYGIIAGDVTALRKYNQEYMRRFSWAEDRNAWLYSLYSREIGES